MAFSVCLVLWFLPSFSSAAAQCYNLASQSNWTALGGGITGTVVTNGFKVILQQYPPNYYESAWGCNPLSMPAGVGPVLRFSVVASVLTQTSALMSAKIGVGPNALPVIEAQFNISTTPRQYTAYYRHVYPSPELQPMFFVSWALASYGLYNLSLTDCGVDHCTRAIPDGGFDGAYPDLAWSLVDARRRAPAGLAIAAGRLQVVTVSSGAAVDEVVVQTFVASAIPGENATITLDYSSSATCAASLDLMGPNLTAPVFLLRTGLNSFNVTAPNNPLSWYGSFYLRFLLGACAATHTFDNVQYTSSDCAPRLRSQTVVPTRVLQQRTQTAAAARRTQTAVPVLAILVAPAVPKKGSSMKIIVIAAVAGGAAVCGGALLLYKLLVSSVTQSASETIDGAELVDDQGAAAKGVVDPEEESGTGSEGAADSGHSEPNESEFSTEV